MAVVALALFFLAVGLASFAVLRMYVRRLRGQELERADKLHRLSRMSTAVLFLAMIAMAFGISALPSPGGSGTTRFAVLGLVVLGLLVQVVAAFAATRSFYRELRELEDEPTSSALKRALRVSTVFLVPGLALSIGRALLPDAWEHNALAMWAYRVGVLLAVFASAPALIGRAFGRSDLDPNLKRDLLELCAAEGIQPRDIRAIEGRRDKHANAFFVGILPRHRYIFVTDYLIERFSRDEVKAVVAHELGHAREHHLLVFLGAFFGASFAGTAAQVAVAPLDGTVGDVATIAVAIISLFAVLWAALGLWLRFEYRADAFAARVVGVDLTIAALEKLAEANMVPRRTGRIWNALNRHPSIEQRVDRLREMGASERSSAEAGRGAPTTA